MEVSLPKGYPRRTIDDLPSELKSRIAELCAEQDEFFFRWTDALSKELTAEGRARRHDTANAPFSVLLHDMCSEGDFDSSLGALFQVSRSWSEVCAPYRFETVRASQVTEDFKWTIGRTRARHFKTIHLDFVSDNECLVDLLYLAPTFPKLECVILEDGFGQFTDADEDSIVHHFGLSALREVIARSTTLRLGRNIPGFRDYSLLPATGVEKLTRLELGTLECFFPGGRLFEWFGSLFILRYLSLITSGEDFPITLPSKPGSPFPSLQHLSLRSDALSPQAVRLAQHFAPSLVSLELEVCGASAAFLHNPAFPPGTFSTDNGPFPRLTRLALRGYAEYTQPLLKTISPDVFPALEHLTLHSSVEECWTPSSGVDPVAGIRTLAKQPFKGPIDISVEGEDCKIHLALIVHAPEGRFRYTPPPFPRPAFASKANLAKLRSSAAVDTPNAFHSGCYQRRLHSLIDFLERRVKMATLANDGVALARLVDLTRPLELERLVLEEGTEFSS